MSLAGKKVGIHMESDFYEDEIFYYKHRFPEDGIEILTDYPRDIESLTLPL